MTALNILGVRPTQSIKKIISNCNCSKLLPSFLSFTSFGLFGFFWHLLL